MATSGPDPAQLGGYPVEIFEQEFDEKYKCNYCSLILRDPVQIFCGHRFCRSCLESHFSSGERCKQCEREGVTDDYSLIQHDQMFPDNAVRREMNKLPVVCPYPGCGWRGTFKDFEAHYINCPFKQITCPECGMSISQNDLDYHLKNECAQRLVTCKLCKAEYKACEQEAHEAVCPKVIVSCPVCGKKAKREKMEAHMKKECSSIPCPVGCADPVDKNKVYEHLNETPVSRHFEPVVHHLESLANEVKTGLPRMKEMIETSEKEMRQMGDKITALERQLVEVMNRPGGAGTEGPGAQSAVVVRQALEIQQGANNEKFQQLEVKTGTFEGIVSALHREIEKTIAAIERMEQNRRTMKDTMEQNQQKIKTLERTLAVKDVTIAELELRVQSSEFASYDGSFIWKVPEFSKKQQDAAAGRSISMYSPPFFTSRRGYKMCARLYPNGDGMGKGSHLSLFFVVMRGQYDALQNWPFKQRVTFCLVNQNGKEHVMDSFRPDPSSSSFKRPTTDMNIASGCPLFLRLENLTNSVNGFLKDDTLFVKIMVDLNDPPLIEPLKSFEDRFMVTELATS